MTQQTNRQLLEAFLLDNPDLDKLEALLDEFNIFEAIGAVRQEVRHSDFLAFLLDPQQQHGLGATFARQLLQAAVREAEQETAVSAIDLALWDLDDLEVRREWQRIDILLLSEANRLAVIIENKVDSDEHSQQLRRYWQTVAQHFPDRRIVGLFLTPDGREPSDERYLPVDYALIYKLVTDLGKTRASVLGSDVQTLLRHYGQLLRRHIMPDSDIAQLAQKIYKKHQRALDLIFEHRPDLQIELWDYLEQIIAQQEPLLHAVSSSKTRIRFFPDAWETPVLHCGKGDRWGDRLLMFEFRNRFNRLTLKLLIQPGDEAIREQVFTMIEENARVFNPPKLKGIRRGNYRTVWQKVILNSSDLDSVSIEDVTPKVERFWKRFLEKDLPKLTAVLQDAAWLWETPDS